MPLQVHGGFFVLWIESPTLLFVDISTQAHSAHYSTSVLYLPQAPADVAAEVSEPAKQKTGKIGSQFRLNSLSEPID